MVYPPGASSRWHRGGRRLTRFSGELRERAGISDNTLQHWVNAGVLLPAGDSHGGRGRHRMFSEREVVIATLLRPLFEIPMPLSRLLTVSGIFRRAYSRRRAARAPDPAETVPDILLPRKTPDGGLEAGLSAPPPNEIEHAREGYRITQARLRRSQDLGSAIARALTGIGANFAVLALAAGNDQIYPGALSDEEGASPFEPTAFLAEANAFFTFNGETGPAATINMVDMEILSGLPD